MKSAILRSETRLRRHPGIAFALSLFSAGLGQAYCGSIQKASAFFLCRIASLLIAPFYAVIREGRMPVPVFLCAILTFLAISLFSCIESSISAILIRGYIPKRHNRAYFYVLFAVSTNAFTCACALTMLVFFSIVKVNSNTMAPGIMRGEYALIGRYSTHDPQMGDIAAYSAGGITKIGRITAGEAEIISLEGNTFKINGTPLKQDKLPADDSAATVLTDGESLILETNCGKRYAVIITDGHAEDGRRETIRIGAGELFITFDNRKTRIWHDIINKNDITGIVSGIIFSKKLSRIFDWKF